MKRLFLIAILVTQLLSFNAWGAWTVDMFDPSHDVQTDMQAIETNINHLKNNFSSATEPSNLSAGQWWYDTTSGILKLRNAANTAWQYIWDFTNNQPMGSVTQTGTATYSGTQLLDTVVLARGTTDTKVAVYGGAVTRETAYNFNIAGGAPVVKGPVMDGVALASGTIPINKWGIYVISINGSGSISVTAGADNFTTGYVDEATAITNIPATPGGTCRLGYVTILTASGDAFIGGTDALAGGTSGNPATTTNYYVDTPTNTMTATITPTPAAYSGVYYVKATYRNYTTTPTLNFNSLGAKTIVRHDGGALVVDDIVAGHDMVLRYDGTYLRLLNPSPDPRPGTVITTLLNQVPAGYLEMDGSAVSRTTYAALFSRIGIQYGDGDGSTTFNLPDVRGLFLRSWAHGSTNDPDRASRTDRGDGTTGDYVGTQQAEEVGQHSHSLNYTLPVDVGGGGTETAVSSGSGYNAEDQSIANYGGSETRPKNINVLYCIKY